MFDVFFQEMPLPVAVLNVDITQPDSGPHANNGYQVQVVIPHDPPQPPR